MLVLKRKEGQWVEITHRSGDLIRIRVCEIVAGYPGHLNLAFDDEARNFEIQRPERNRTPDMSSEVRKSLDDQTLIPIDRKYYRGTLVDPGFDEFQR